MSKQNGRKYVPQKKYNPALLNQRIDSLLATINRNRQRRDMELASLKNHFSKLTNFTSHDIKNAIQNMDSVISTLKIDAVTPDNITTIKTCLKAMRQSLNDFAKLSPDGRKIEFIISELAHSVLILNRASFNEYKVKYSFDFDENDSTIIKQSFHNILQIINNLIINSLTALEKRELERKICIRFAVENDNINIQVLDNGSPIPSDIRKKIFEIYFSTTGGSGIGLAHTSYILETIDGNITLLEGDNEYCTKFEVNFPIENITKEEEEND